jgi:hypothetical protein
MITIGQTIYSLLTGSTIITGYTGLNIFPLFIPENTPLPCIMYERRSNNEFTKDSLSLYDITVDIMILSEDYSLGIDISTAVNNVLNGYKNGNIRDTKFMGVDELCSDDGVIIQKLSYNIKSV